MNSNRKKSAALIFVAVFFSLVVPVHAQEAGLWFRTPGATNPVATVFESLVFNYLQSSGRASYEKQQIAPDLLRQRLQALDPSKITNPIVIHCTMQEYLLMLKDPQWKQLLESLQLDLLNSRLFSFPFFLFKERAASIQSAGGSVEVAWITIPEGVKPVEEADLLTMLSETLGRPKSSVKIYRERGAYPAAKRLYEGGYTVIGIYENEPSSLLDEFRVNWEEELKADPVELLGFDSKRISNQLVPVSPDRLAYSFFQYSGQPFGPYIPDGRPLLAIVQQLDHPFPVLLSNIHHLNNQGLLLPAAFSYAYFLMPSTPALLAEPGERRTRVEQLYLLNSYLEDPESRLKGLGLLGSLLMKEQNGSKQQRELYSEKCNVFQKKLNLTETSAPEILKWLGMSTPVVGKRELFTSDVSRLYQEALQQIDRALQSTGSERIDRLEKARAGLVAALLQGSRPRNVQGSRGLWSVENYNPFYQLARVALYLEVEQRRSK